MPANETSDSFDKLDTKTQELLNEIIEKICNKKNIKLDDKQLNVLRESLAQNLAKGSLNIADLKNEKLIAHLTIAIVLTHTLKNNPNLQDKNFIEALKKILTMKPNPALTPDALKKLLLENVFNHDQKKLDQFLDATQAFMKVAKNNLFPSPKPGNTIKEQNDPLQFLLGIMNPNQTGTMQVALAVFNGDFLGIPNQNPYASSSEDNLHIKTNMCTGAYNDPLGLLAQQSEIIEQLGDVCEEIIDAVERLEKHIKMTTPYNMTPGHGL